MYFPTGGLPWTSQVEFIIIIYVCDKRIHVTILINVKTITLRNLDLHFCKMFTIAEAKFHVYFLV